MQKQDLEKLLGAQGILPTPQRLEIAAIILERPQHLSADDIIDRLRRRGSKVSKATVYNTLKLFGERDVVREVMVDPVRKFYDSTTHDHHHFYNVDTGRLTDIPVDAIGLSALPPLPEGTREDGIDVIIRVRNR